VGEERLVGGTERGGFLGYSRGVGNSKTSSPPDARHVRPGSASMGDVWAIVTPSPTAGGVEAPTQMSHKEQT
jgi:hypothetical protein